MSTAVQEKKIVVFVHKYIGQGYTINRKHDDSRVDSNGNHTNTKGKYARFINGVLKTNDPETIKYLRNHSDYGVFMHETEALDASSFRDNQPKVSAGVAGTDSKQSSKEPESPSEDSEKPGKVKFPKRGK